MEFTSHASQYATNSDQSLTVLLKIDVVLKLFSKTELKSAQALTKKGRQTGSLLYLRAAHNRGLHYADYWTT